MNALSLEENRHECKETRRKLSSFSFPTPGNLVLTLDPGLAIIPLCTEMRQLRNKIQIYKYPVYEYKYKYSKDKQNANTNIQIPCTYTNTNTMYVHD